MVYIKPLLQKFTNDHPYHWKIDPGSLPWVFLVVSIGKPSPPPFWKPGVSLLVSPSFTPSLLGITRREERSYNDSLSNSWP